MLHLPATVGSMTPTEMANFIRHLLVSDPTMLPSSLSLKNLIVQSDVEANGATLTGGGTPLVFAYRNRNGDNSLAHRSTNNQTIANATETAISFRDGNTNSAGVMVWPGGRYDGSDSTGSSPAPTWPNTTQIPIPIDGFYHVEGQASFAANATGQRRIGISVNAQGLLGTTTSRGVNVYASPPAGLIQAMVTSAMFHLYAGDYIELYVNQNSGGNLAIQADDLDTGNPNPRPTFSALLVATDDDVLSGLPFGVRLGQQIL